MIRDYAKKENIEKIFFGDSGQRTVNNIFSMLCKGKGYSIDEEINYVKKISETEPLFSAKPMRDFIEKEVNININNFLNFQLNLRYSFIIISKKMKNLYCQMKILVKKVILLNFCQKKEV